MKTLFLIAALLMGVAARPALAQIVWQEGEATLSTGIIVRSELCYQPDSNALLVRSGSTCRTYTASQLQCFQYVNTADVYRHFTVHYLPKNGQPDELAPLILEELIPGATVRLLQLPGNRAERIGKQYGLPATRTSDWQTPQPWYVWIDGRFVAPDAFVETELSDLLASSPEAVQRWANARPRPGNPKALARWLAHYYREMESAKQTTAPTIVSWRK